MLILFNVQYSCLDALHTIYTIFDDVQGAWKTLQFYSRNLFEFLGYTLPNSPTLSRPQTFLLSTISVGVSTFLLIYRNFSIRCRELTRLFLGVCLLETASEYASVIYGRQCGARGF